MRLYLVCDISGSMDGDGKPFILRTFALAVAQWVRLGYGHADITLCAWTPGAAVLADWNARQDYPPQLLVCSGTARWKNLIETLGERPDGKVLLLSDGFWPRGEARIFRQWKEGLPPDTLRIVKAGVDANAHLKGPGVFAAEELFSALDGWLGDDPE